MRNIAFAFLTVLVALLAPSARAEPILIDDFESGGPFSVTTSGIMTFPTRSVAIPSFFSPLVFGGFRRGAIFDDTGLFSTATATLADTDGDDALVYNVVGTGSRLLRGGLLIKYGNEDANEDFSAYSAARLFISDAPNAGTLSMSFRTGPEFQQGGVVFTSIPISGPGDYILPFSSFSFGLRFSFAEVDTISVSIDATGLSNVTFAISEITIVPEPSIALLQGLGLLTLAIYRRESALR